MVKMTETKDCEEIAKLSYLAGIVDGEGSIIINKDKARRGRTSKQNRGESHALLISMGNTNSEVVRWIEERFGGGTYRQRRNRPRRDVYFWRVWGIEAYKLLKKIRPFLVIKRKQAELGITFQESCKRSSWNSRRPMWLVERERNFKEEMSKLNLDWQEEEEWL